MCAALSREDILRLLQAEEPLVEGLSDLSRQVQPNGVDLTVKQVDLLCSSGKLGLSNEKRVLSDTSRLAFDGLGGMTLLPGCYIVTYNEIVNLPRNVMALATPRSSLLRCGVSIHTAVWDAGYSGRSQSLLVVYNPYGFAVQKNARLLQIVFFYLSGEVTEGYDGIFQRENI